MNYQNNKASFLFKKRALVELEQKGEELKINWLGDAEENEIVNEVMNKFRLKDDMKLIYGKIIRDKFMLDAVTELYGLRLTLSDPWEALVCFICSINNNLRNIKCIIGNLSRMFGEKVEVGDKYFYSFPDISSILKADFRALRECKLGFRTDYLKNAANACSDKIDLTSISSLSYLDGRMELMRIKGIGEKIADCVMLFAYGRLESFPVDVWVRRTMSKVYFQNKKITDNKIREFARCYWNGYAGYAQQYVYWHGRNKSTNFF
jgi:N-glycosylase/DNA lyase